MFFVRFSLGIKRATFDIAQIVVADVGVPIPSIHRVDCLGKLGTIVLVDVVGIDPHPFEFVSGSLFPKLLDFEESGTRELGLGRSLSVLDSKLQLLVGDFISSPAV
jgi:hypothetical protein